MIFLVKKKKKWIVSCISLSMKKILARELNNSGKGKKNFVFNLSFLIQIGPFT